MDTALSVINVMPSTKEQVEAFSGQVIAEVEAGNIDPLKLYTKIKFIERTLEAITKGVKEKAMNEAAKHGKRFEFNGFRIEEVEAGVSYDYSADPVHTRLKEKIKEREAILKAVKTPFEEVDTETGETFTVAPPVKKSTTSLKFSYV